MVNALSSMIEPHPRMGKRLLPIGVRQNRLLCAAAQLLPPDVVSVSMGLCAQAVLTPLHAATGESSQCKSCTRYPARASIAKRNHTHRGSLRHWGGSVLPQFDDHQLPGANG